jgi:hypothetical protein
MLRVNPRKRMFDEVGADALEFVDERLCLCGDVKPPGPAVARVSRALDEPRLLETIDDAAQGDRLELEHVGELDLPKAGFARQLEQHLPLRARDSEPDREAIEGLAQRVRRLADLKRNRFHQPQI